MTRIKICGMTSEEDIRLCAAAGVHALGFVVEYPIDVPWNLDRRRARELMRTVPPFVSRVIVVGDDPATGRRIGGVSETPCGPTPRKRTSFRDGRPRPRSQRPRRSGDQGPAHFRGNRKVQFPLRKPPGGREADCGNGSRCPGAGFGQRCYAGGDRPEHRVDHGPQNP